MKKIIILAILLISVNLIFAQENIGIGTNAPDPSAVLDIRSTDRGILIPRTDTSAVNAYLTSVGSAETGLMIFQTSDASFYFFNGSKWEKIGGNAEGLIDQDKDTQIKLIEFAQDKMEYYLDGVKHFEMTKNASGTARINVLNNNRNVGIGRSLLSNTTGDNNVGIGLDALLNNTTGSLNTAVGTEALISNQSGAQNVSVGYEALFSNNGSFNTSLGSLSLTENTSGSNNTAVGQFALRFNSTGSGNIAIGAQAGANESGSDKLYIENSPADSSGALIYGDFAADSLRINGKLNINGEYAFPAVGGSDRQSLIMQSDGSLDWESNTSLSDNDNDTKISVEATPDIDQISFDLKGETKFLMERNGNGIATLKFKNNNFNTLVGDGAGKDLISSSDGSNTIIGRFAGSKITDGTRNTFLGGSAGETNNGNRNTFVGLFAGADNVVGSNNVFIGNRAGMNELGSNKLYIANAGGDSSEVLIYGDFAADSLRINGKLNINGEYALPEMSGSNGQSLVMQLDGTLDWGAPSSSPQDLISFSDFQDNTLKLHQMGLLADTVLVDLSSVVAAGLDLNGQEVNKGVGIRYFICATSGSFPSPVTPNPDPVIGEVKLFAGPNDLAGWLPCEGQMLNPANYSALFAVIGTQYGGDGLTTFALPDLRNAVPVHN